MPECVPFHGIAKLESGCIYGVAIPPTVMPQRLKEYQEYFEETTKRLGIDVKFIFIPTA